MFRLNFLFLPNFRRKDQVFLRSYDIDSYDVFYIATAKVGVFCPVFYALITKNK